jgi:hypothetical protein
MNLLGALEDGGLLTVRDELVTSGEIQELNGLITVEQNGNIELTAKGEAVCDVAFQSGPVLCWRKGEAGDPVRTTTCGRGKLNELDGPHNQWCMTLDGERLGSYAAGIRDGKKRLEAAARRKGIRHVLTGEHTAPTTTAKARALAQLWAASRPTRVELFAWVRAETDGFELDAAVRRLLDLLGWGAYAGQDSPGYADALELVRAVRASR